MENEVEDFFYEEQNKSGHGEQYLKVFRAQFGCRYGLHSPLRGGPLAESANAPDRI